MLKRICFFLIIFLASIFLYSCSASSTVKEKTYDLSIEYSFDGIKEGYDHLTKLIVSINGEVADTSTKKYQSKVNSLLLSLPAGEHTIKAECLAFYDGFWEPHLRNNGYNVDCVYETRIIMTENKNMKILFDLEKGPMLVSLN